MQQRYFLHLAYSGTDFSGWQIQPNAPSIQEEIENALTKLNRNNKVAVVGCGRTDAGVHASSFYAHFDFDKYDLPDDIVVKLNKMLPKSIVIFDCFEVSNDAHARFDATYRYYQYKISKVKNPFQTNFYFEYRMNLNLEIMNEACDILLNTTDFTSFSKLHTDTFTNDCDVTLAKWTETENGYLFEIKANRFLRNMVRAVVGTTIEVGQGKISLKEFETIVKSKNRNNAGASVPASGLFLADIGYDYLKKKK